MKVHVIITIIVLGLALLMLPTTAVFSDLPPNQVVIVVTIRVLETNSWIEFKLESDELGGEYATGHIKVEGRYMWTVDVGSPNQNIWMWWDRLDGIAHLEVFAFYKGEKTPLLVANCQHLAHGNEIAPSLTIRSKKILKTYGSPRIKNGNGEIDYIVF